jgi:hypothetical protein
MKKKYIKRSSLSHGLPLWQTITMYLLLDKLQVSDLAWGIWIALFGIAWIACIVGIWTQQAEDVPGFGDKS